MEFATAVTGALLGASFEKLFDKLASRELRQLFASEEASEAQRELQVWEEQLPMIQAVLEDAEEKQMQKTGQHVKMWLSELRDLVYDVDDVLDVFETEALRRKLKKKDKHQAAASGSGSTSYNKVRRFVPSALFTTTCFKSTSSSSSSSSPRSSGGSGGDAKFSIAEMGTKLKDITARLERICTRKSKLNLGERAAGGGGSSVTTRETTPLLDSHIFGRDKDKQAIIDLLLAPASGGGRVSVIPIQGMGGVGKTTLAQLVYNDPKVEDSFHLKAWVCVSDTFHIFNITKAILQWIDPAAANCNDKTLAELQVKLENILSGKKFLIVLDDVWNENYEEWTKLYKPFQGGAPGSKLIVTTRNQGVASMMATTKTCRLAGLSDNDCLSLFAQHALGAPHFDEHLELKDIGVKIVGKCKGLPLAAKTLGGLLRTKLHRKDWLDILESEIWNLPQEKSDILLALRLSYHHLPSHLKQCFAYCAVFPKDSEFDKNDLVLLWMAEGFIHHTRANKPMEDISAKYFSDLLSRSFFQPSSEDGASFVMHDLIHDLAQSVAGEICFNLDASWERGECSSAFQKTRHSSFIRRRHEVSGRFAVFREGGSAYIVGITYSCIST